jgi:hypothetical protein
MDPNIEGENIEELNKKLYKKDSDLSYKRLRLKKHDYETKGDWDIEEKKKTKKRRAVIQSSLLMKLFFISLGFFMLAMSVAAYQIWIKPRVVKPEDVRIEVKAPTTIPGGEETQISIIIKNRNDVSVESADLEIIYPEGVVPADMPNESNYRYRKSLGAILPDEEVAENISIIVNSILLSVVYFVGVGLTSIIAKIAKKEFLETEMKRESYWSPLNLKKEDEENYYRLF